MGAPVSVCTGGIRLNGKGSARWLGRALVTSRDQQGKGTELTFSEFSSDIHKDTDSTDTHMCKHTQIHIYNKLMFKKVEKNQARQGGIHP